METDNGNKRFNWRLPLYTAVLTIAICFLDALVESDGLVYVLIAALVSLLFLVVLLIAAIAKKLRLCMVLLSMLLVFWVVSFATFKNYYAIRNNARWSLWSHRYTAEVLARPEPENGELKHVEWDGWGFAGAGDTNVYLVFDPTDSLSAAAKSHQPGKFNGIPCKVPLVSRLENRWYAVRFYTDERWGKAHLDCGAAD
jgi:energy-coupling factor transporter transmembrane protein EcfT